MGYLQRGATQNTTDTAKKGGELLPMVRRVAPTSIVTLNVLKTTVKNNRLPNNQQQPKKQTALDLQDCRRLPRAGFPLRKEFRKNRQRRARAARGRPLKRRVKRSDKTELDCIQFGPALQVPQYTHTHHPLVLDACVVEMSCIGLSVYRCVAGVAAGVRQRKVRGSQITQFFFK